MTTLYFIIILVIICTERTLCFNPDVDPEKEKYFYIQSTINDILLQNGHETGIRCVDMETMIPPFIPVHVQEYYSIVHLLYLKELQTHQEFHSLPCIEEIIDNSSQWSSNFYWQVDIYIKKIKELEIGIRQQRKNITDKDYQELSNLCISLHDLEDRYLAI